MPRTVRSRVEAVMPVVRKQRGCVRRAARATRPAARTTPGPGHDRPRPVGQADVSRHGSSRRPRRIAAPCPGATTAASARRGLQGHAHGENRPCLGIHHRLLPPCGRFRPPPATGTSIAPFRSRPYARKSEPHDSLDRQVSGADNCPGGRAESGIGPSSVRPARTCPRTRRARERTSGQQPVDPHRRSLEDGRACALVQVGRSRRGMHRAASRSSSRASRWESSSRTGNGPRRRRRPWNGGCPRCGQGRSGG